jgi:hypothetical protein
MSEIQEEAYSEAMEEIARLKILVWKLADALQEANAWPRHLKHQEWCNLVNRAKAIRRG